MKILVTGGCGFIGSNFIKYLLENNLAEKVINYDKQTYAGKGRNIEHMGLNKDTRHKFYYGDICDRFFIKQVIKETKPDYIFNFAAESHVDRSINSDEIFTMTNVFGTGVLLNAAREQGIERFVQIGTDEVYGSLNKTSPSSKETDQTKPNSPYSASKLGADALVLSYFTTHQLPVCVTRSSNNYGPYQYQEKLLPLFITNLLEGKKVPLMWSEENPGLNIRDWLHVEDNCRAIWYVANYGEPGEIYNIPGNNERTNIEMTKMLLEIFGMNENMIKKISHRKGHDFRYSIDGTKLKKLGFKHIHLELPEELKKLCQWYKENGNWWRSLKK